LNKGYCLRAHRYKTPVFEVDLIVENKDEVLILEVKTIHSSDYNSYKISPQQKKRIQNGYRYLERFIEKDLGVRYVTVDGFNKIEDFEIPF
jgi:Holliday junction resolvase-like predicted endonuclease